MNPIRLICRNSKLSITQVNEIRTLLPNSEFNINHIASYGDKHKQISLLENFESDLFTRELDQAILDDTADIAVHSAKDLPYPLPEGIEVIALTRATHKADSLVSRKGLTIDQLPSGSIIGTSSPSRRNQLLAYRSDLEIKGVRGNIDERIEKIKSGEIDALIVAECALRRLGYEHLIHQVLPFETHPLQGNLAVCARAGQTYLKTLFYPIDERKNHGKVFLVGSGPGDAELLTLRAQRILREADIIFHDALVNPSIYNDLPAEIVNVGKRKGKHSFDQEQINDLLYKAALAGKNVVRLKGGDPLLFGRGGEEFDHLRSRLIEVEIVPGITTAQAAASVLGISLTHRAEASSVAFCTGYPADKIQVPGADTLVYYMGSSNLQIIAERNLEKGKSPDTPVVLVSHVSLPQQQVHYTNLQAIRSNKLDLKTPLLVIIGEVARFKNPGNLQSKSSRVLVTGTNTRRFQHLGEVIHNPVIQIEPLSDYSTLVNKFSKGDAYDAIVFTSQYAVRFFFAALKKNTIDIRTIAQSRIFSIGKTTSAELRKHGIVADHQADDESATGIIDLFREMEYEGKTVLLPRSNLAPDYLPINLERLGYRVTSMVIYRNSLPRNYIKTKLDSIDIIAFSSPSGVKNFLNLYGSIPSHIKTIAIGNPTRLTLDKYDQTKPILIDQK